MFGADTDDLLTIVGPPVEEAVLLIPSSISVFGARGDCSGDWSKIEINFCNLFDQVRNMITEKFFL